MRSVDFRMLFAITLLLLANSVFGAEVHEVMTSNSTQCTVQKPPVSPNTIQCGPNTTATLEDARAIAWKFAPVLKFHPLESYHLQSMDVWYDLATIYLTDYKPYPNSSYNYIVSNQTNRDLLGPKTFATLLNSSTTTEEAARSNALAGAPFVDGKSTADMFYTVTDYSDSLWLYNFNLFYAWNGCSNQAVSLSFNGTTDTQEYLMCPAGVHEADLERVSVLVCKNDQKIKQITYSQHAWSEVRDCQIEGQCLFDNATGNPISYVALEGHGNYPESVGDGFHVYYYQGSAIDGFPLRNIGGIYIGDRTGDDPEKTFIPTPDNVKYIPPLWEIQEDYQGIRSAEWEWAVFPGNWGAPLVQASTKLVCIDTESEEYFECDRNSTTIKAIYSIVDVLGLVGIVQDQEGVSNSFAIQSVSNLTRVPYPDITGPLFRAFSYQYVAGDTAPILTESVYELECPKDVTALDEMPNLESLDAGPSTITWYLVGITIGTLIFSIILIILLALPVILDKTSFVQKYVATKYKKMRRATGMTPEAVEGIEVYPRTRKSKSRDQMANPKETDPVDASDVSQISDAPHYLGLSDPSISMASTTSTKSAYIMSVNTVLTSGQVNRMIVWGSFATGLFVAGLVVSSIGVSAMFNNSILTVAADKLNADSLVSALYWLSTGCLIFICVLDVVMFFMLFMFQDRRVYIFDKPIWNPLGGWHWFMNKALTILSIVIGLIALEIAISTILFSLGLLITIIQLAARVGCNAVFSISVFGQNLESVCLDIETINLRVCGWEALQACGNATNMSVRNLLIGSMMLQWCHIVWMIVLLSILETYRSHEIHVSKSKKAARLLGDEVADDSLSIDPWESTQID
jgi:hypothetical protein